MNEVTGGTRSAYGRWSRPTLIACVAVATVAALQGCQKPQPEVRGVRRVNLHDKGKPPSSCVAWAPGSNLGKVNKHDGVTVSFQSTSSCKLEISFKHEKGSAAKIWTEGDKPITLEPGAGLVARTVASNAESGRVDFELTVVDSSSCFSPCPADSTATLKPEGAGGPGMDICPPRC